MFLGAVIAALIPYVKRLIRYSFRVIGAVRVKLYELLSKVIRRYSAHLEAQLFHTRKLYENCTKRRGYIYSRCLVSILT